MKRSALLYQFNESPVIVHESPSLDVTLEIVLCLVMTGLMPAIVAISLYLTGSI